MASNHFVRARAPGAPLQATGPGMAISSGFELDGRPLHDGEDVSLALESGDRCALSVHPVAVVT